MKEVTGNFIEFFIFLKISKYSSKLLTNLNLLIKSPIMWMCVQSNKPTEASSGWQGIKYMMRPKQDCSGRQQQRFCSNTVSPLFLPITGIKDRISIYRD